MATRQRRNRHQGLQPCPFRPGQPLTLVSHSHGAVAWYFLPYFPCSAAFATPRCPFSFCYIPSLAQSPRFTPHPVFLPQRAASNTLTRGHWILIYPGTLSCVLHVSLLSRPLVFVLSVSCLTPWGRCAVLGTPSPWPRPRIPCHYPCPYPTGLPESHVCTPIGRMLPCGACPRVCFLPHALVAPIRCPAACSLSAVCRLVVCLCFLCGGSFFCAHPMAHLPPPFPLCVRALSRCFPLLLFSFYPPPCMHARHHCAGHLVTAPLCPRLWSSRPRGAFPLPVPGHARWGRSLASPCHLSPPRPTPVTCLPPVRLAAHLRARAVSCAPSRVFRHVPGPPSCRPIWAASQCTPSGGFPRRLPPPASSPSVP